MKESNSILRESEISAKIVSKKPSALNPCDLQKITIFDGLSDLVIADKISKYMKDDAVVKCFHELLDLSENKTLTIFIPAGDPASWVHCWGEKAQFADGRLRVDGAMRSFVGMPAKAGKKYQCEYSVRASLKPANGRAVSYFLAPIALNSNGKIIQTTVLRPQVAVANGSRRGEVNITACEEAHTIHIGIKGPNKRTEKDSFPEFEWFRFSCVNED